MKVSLISLTLITALAMSGCTKLGPEYEKPEVAVPLTWPSLQGIDGQTQNHTVSRWLNDDKTLMALHSMLEKHNQSLQVAALNFASSRVYRQVAGSSGEPEAGFSGSIKRQRLSEDGSMTRFIKLSSSGEQQDALTDALASPFSVYSTGFDASWEPDLWGKVANQIDAADAQQTLAESELADLRLSLTTELMRRYVQYRAQQAVLALQQQKLANLHTQLSIQEAWIAAGLGDESERLALEAQIHQLNGTLDGQRSEVHVLANQLSLLVGAQPGALTPLLEGPHDAFHEYVLSTLNVPSSVLSQRPDIRAAEAKVRAATAEIGIAEAALYPQFQLTGNVGIEALSSSAVSDWSSRTWQIGPGFYLPLFNRNQLHRQVEITSITQQQTIVQYQKQVLSAWTEVDSAIEQANSAGRQLEQSQQALSRITQRLTLTKTDAEAGLSSELPVLMAQQQWLDAKVGHIQSQLNVTLSQLSVYKATGGPGMH